MYNDEIRNTVISDLERKTISVADTAIVLASQGYLINRNKYIKLDWASILIHAFENIDILTKEQQDSVERIYNKVSTI